MIRLPWVKVGSHADREDTVPGERGATVVTRVRSLQSRLSNLMAAALVMTVGGTLLAWYYDQALTRAPRTRHSAMAASAAAAQSRMPLPPLGPIVAPHLIAPAARQARRSPQAPRGAVSANLPIVPEAQYPFARPVGESGRISPGALALERRLSGGVFAAAPNDAGTSGAASDAGKPISRAQLPLTAGALGASRVDSHADALESLLAPGVLKTTRAQLLPGERLLLPKGTFINCTLETAIDSTLPGMTTCVTSTDTFGADGTVVLLERGSQLIGETRSRVRQGEARVFVVWTEARTPQGVVVRLDSPGTDALGRSGLTGKVNRHFWQRFGAAALISTIDGAAQAEVASSSRGGAIVLNPTASEDVLNGLLQSTVDIAPTVEVPNGARIQVLVARDVDFRSVYELEPR